MRVYGNLETKSPLSPLETGAVYDKIYREDVIREAWKRVKANKGAPGVDKQDFSTIEQEIGVEPFLGEVREQLKSERYRPQPVLY